MNHKPLDNAAAAETGQSADSQTGHRSTHQELQGTDQSALQAEETLAEQLSQQLETIRAGSTAASSTVQHHPDFERLSPVLEKLYHLTEYLRQLPADASTTAEDDAGSVDASQHEPAQARVTLCGHIGKYEIVRTLGRGGQGSTYLAFDPDLERHVVIKL